MTTIAKTTRLPEQLLKGIKYRTQREGTDESTALRQLLTLGIQEYAIKLYKAGLISLREAAHICNTTTRDMLDLLLDHGVKGNIQYATQKQSLEIIRNL
ncbi:UPF0175 family protein [Candidatus Woesearchaeota archaeon]|nr:UPF0175 family protein [Candidatus Woesearchaeota archaeon]